MISILAAKVAQNGGSMKLLLYEVERQSIMATLNRFNWNKAKSYRHLNMPRSSFLNIVNAHGLKSRGDKVQ